MPLSVFSLLLSLLLPLAHTQTYSHTRHLGRTDGDVSPILEASGRTSGGPHRKLGLRPLQFRGRRSLGSSTRPRNGKVGQSSRAGGIVWEVPALSLRRDQGYFPWARGGPHKIDGIGLAAAHSLVQAADKMAGENGGGGA